MSRRRGTIVITARTVAELLREVERYLAAVDAFRAEGREPTWR